MLGSGGALGAAALARRVLGPLGVLPVGLVARFALLVLDLLDGMGAFLVRFALATLIHLLRRCGLTLQRRVRVGGGREVVVERASDLRERVRERVVAQILGRACGSLAR